MWYKNSYRRHLCDMHIDEWNDEFLSKFDPKEYYENLKRAKINSAMIYFQSHMGLCYYPTKAGKVHNAFIGRENAVKELVDLCRNDGIAVTGYYSLIYNNYEHDRHPDWRMVNNDGVSKRMVGLGEASDFAGSSKVYRYGLCCPNNPDYRAFVKEQIKEMSEYFKVDGMFYDMLFWTHMCYCEHCRKRWENEVGGEIPTEENWKDKRWLLHMHKRREWMGEFAQWATDLTKKLFGNISVEHNVSQSALPSSFSSNAEEVLEACDYAGGDLYVDMYRSSFACKFYRSITKNQPFEYMISRSSPNLGVHTQIKSEDALKSSVFLTTAHHGASLIIDAIDPVGTLSKNVFERIGTVYGESEPYEKYMSGASIEEVGVYYSLKSKFSPNNEKMTNYVGVTNAIKTLICDNILCGVTGGFHDISKYKVLIAPMLTCEDDYDTERIADYVRNGGNLYFSGGDNEKLIKEFFGAEIVKRTEETAVYISPCEKIKECFLYFDEKYPLNYTGSAPVAKGIAKDNVAASLTLPYTAQDVIKFASIHSNPPGISTDIPAIAVTDYGKGKVIWSACPIECIEIYDHRRIFVNLLKGVFGFEPRLLSDADEDIEITAFEEENSVQLCAVLLNTSYKARKVAPFNVSFKCEKKPKKVTLLPCGKEIDFTFEDNRINFEIGDLKIFAMYNIQF